MAATDDWSTYAVPPFGPCRNAVAVTPSDSTALADVTRYLYVGGAGTLTVILRDGSTSVAFGAVTAGSLIPIAVSQVKATGTSATSIVAMW